MKKVVIKETKCKACGHSDAEHDANTRGAVPDPWCDCCFDFPFDTVNAETEQQ